MRKLDWKRIIGPLGMGDDSGSIAAALRELVRQLEARLDERYAASGGVPKYCVHIRDLIKEQMIACDDIGRLHFEIVHIQGRHVVPSRYQPVDYCPVCGKPVRG